MEYENDKHPIPEAFSGPGMVQCAWCTYVVFMEDYVDECDMLPADGPTSFQGLLIHQCPVARGDRGLCEICEERMIRPGAPGAPVKTPTHRTHPSCDMGSPCGGHYCYLCEVPADAPHHIDWCTAVENETVWDIFA